MLSIDNLEAIGRIQVNGKPLEIILAVPAGRYNDFDTLLARFHGDYCATATDKVVGEFEWQGHRLIVAHRTSLAKELADRREQRIKALEDDAKHLANKLNDQDAGQRHRGRKLSDGGATARFYQAVCETKLALIIKVHLSAYVFRYTLDKRALKRAQMLDCKLILVSNVPDLDSATLVDQYRALADIERGFRVLKSEIEITPVFHRLLNRINAHTMIGFLALILYRVLRQRLNNRESPYWPERALEIARRIQHHHVTSHQRQSASGITKLNPEQRELFDTIGLTPPTSTPCRDKGVRPRFNENR